MIVATKQLKANQKGIISLLYFRHLHLFCGFFAIINDIFGKNHPFLAKIVYNIIGRGNLCTLNQKSWN